LTYYVVAHSGVLPAVLPLGCVTHKNKNVLDSKDNICNKNLGLRGVYLWTHVESGKQYIGSSKNLGLRLNEYFRPSYLQTQSIRGSAICRAILTHGHSTFTLSVYSLGQTPETLEKFSSQNLPDYVVLEQEFLNKFTLVYNINRTASSSAYSPSTSQINIGKDNPSFGVYGEEAFAWNQQHSAETKSQWSKERGKTTFYLYSSLTFNLIEVFTSGVKLAAFFPDVSKRFGSDVTKMILNYSSAIRYLEYIISIVPMDSDTLQTLLNDLPIKPYSIPRSSPTGKFIYGFNPTTLEYREWASKEKCTFDLTGRKFENKATVDKRIDKKILYYKFYLQTKPFKPE